MTPDDDRAIIVGQHTRGKTHAALDAVERTVERALVEMDNVRGIIGWDQAKVVSIGLTPVAPLLGSAILYAGSYPAGSEADEKRQRTVADLIASYKRGDPVPPIAVERIGGDRVRVIDGYHRVLALSDMGTAHAEALFIKRPQSIDYEDDDVHLGDRSDPVEPDWREHEEEERA